MRQNDWVVIPAKDEEKHIEDVLIGCKRHCENVIVVNDASSDDTSAIAKEYALVVDRKRSFGKGSALKEGCDLAIRKGAKRLIVMDSDGQHDPDDIPRFLKNLEGKDIVFGSRKFDGKMPVLMFIGNWFISLVSKLFFGVKVKDTQSGFRAFTSSAYEKIRWKSRDYSMESEMIARAGKNKLKYSEIFIKTVYHDNNKGTTVLDGVRIVSDMFRWKLGGLR